MLKLIKHVGVAVLCLMIQAGAYAGNAVPGNLETGWQRITQSQLKADVSYLASDKLAGRLALTEGDAKSIDWIVAQFKVMGLKPAVEGNSYLQPVNVIAYMPDKKNNYMELKTAGRTFKWKKPDVTMEFYRNLDLQGEIVFAGYGITAPDLGYDDYQHIDVRGKVVMVFEHEPQERNSNSLFNGTSNTIYATNRIKALNAQKQGAIAILIAPEPNRKHLSNQERYNRVGGSVSRKKPLPSMVLEGDELTIPVVVLSDKVANKIAGKSLSLSALQSAIDRDLTPHSLPIPNASIVIHDIVLSSKTDHTYNVAGLLEGADKSLNEETIIISAHHDHDGKSGKQIWHGADDNASGTAAVVSLANAITENSNASNGLKPKRSILFVVFGGEERGLLGSYYMAKHPLRSLDKTRAVLNFDMIGRNEKPSLQTKGMIATPKDTTNRLNLVGAHFSPDYMAVVEQENAYTGLVLDHRFDNDCALNSLFRSDQFPFILQKIPAFGWSTGFHPDYHHATDTADKINYVKMQKIVRLAYLTAYKMAEDGKPLVFVKNPGLKDVH